MNSMSIPRATPVTRTGPGMSALAMVIPEISWAAPHKSKKWVLVEIQTW